MKLGISRATRLASGAAALAIGLALAACDACGASIHTGVLPVPVADGSAAERDCLAACAVRRDAGCDPYPAPACENACTTDKAQGVAAELSTTCVLSAGTDRTKLAACGACSLDGGAP